MNPASLNLDGWREAEAAARRDLFTSAAITEPAPKRPLRIAMLGWTVLSAQQREGSGMNLFASELATALVLRGHYVASLRSGMEYTLRPGVRIELREVWRGVPCFDLYNSPNLATGNFNLRNPREQAASPATASLVAAWLREIEADVLHVHSFEGVGFDVVAAATDAGVPVVYTPHNYFALCPQVDLFRNEREICTDYEGGVACATCIEAPDPRAESARRRRLQTAHRLFGTLRIGQVAKTMRKALAPPAPPRLGSAPAWAGGTAPPLPPRFADRASRTNPVDPDSCEKLLTADHHLKVLSPHGERRRAAVAALNRCAAILCPSTFLMRTHAAMGVDASILSHAPLGQPHFDAVRSAALSSPFAYEPLWRPGRGTPLRLAFYGNTHPNKGLATVLHALLEMPEHERRMLHVQVRATGWDEPFRRLVEALPNVAFHGAYDVRDLPALLQECDVGLFPNRGLDNSPFVLLEYLHAGRFALASDVGGPTGFINHAHNGLLVRAGDPAAWSRAISSIVRGETPLPTPRSIIEASPLVTWEACITRYENALAGAARAV